MMEVLLVGQTVKEVSSQVMLSQVHYFLQLVPELYGQKSLKIIYSNFRNIKTAN